jgi:hypothetical protein
MTQKAHDLTQSEVETILSGSPTFSRLFSNLYAAEHGGALPPSAFVARQVLELEDAGFHTLQEALRGRRPGIQTRSNYLAGLFYGVAFAAFYEDPAKVDWEKSPTPSLELLRETGVGTMAPLADFIGKLDREELFQLFTALAVRVLAKDAPQDVQEAQEGLLTGGSNDRAIPDRSARS